MMVPERRIDPGRSLQRPASILRLSNVRNALTTGMFFRIGRYGRPGHCDMGCMIINSLDNKATFEQNDPELLVVRFRTGVRLSEEVISATIRQCREPMFQRPRAVLVVIPEGVDFDPHAMSVDLARTNGMVGSPAALAVVCEERTLECMVELYFAYFPQPFAVKVFEEFHEAYVWLLDSALTRCVA